MINPPLLARTAIDLSARLCYDKTNLSKPISLRLMENVHMQGFRNRGPAPKGWGRSRVKRR
jgi:hypothetical protein